MGNFSRKIDVENLISYSDDLINVLKDKKDINNLTQCLDHSKSLFSSCNADFNEVQTLLQDYQKKIDVCKQKIEEAKSEVADETEVDHLNNELDLELETESALREELRIITNEIADLERQRISIEEQKQTVKKLEQEKLREQRKLSMYASVTNIIPDLDDQSRIAGHIVDRDQKVINKFEFDPRKVTDYDTCNSIWKMISLR